MVFFNATHVDDGGPKEAPANWVIGALCAELSAVLTTLGTVFARRAFVGRKSIEMSWPLPRAAAQRVNSGGITLTSPMLRAPTRYWRARTLSEGGTAEEDTSQRKSDIAPLEADQRGSGGEKADGDKADGEKADGDKADRDKAGSVLGEVLWKFDFWLSIFLRGIGVLFFWRAGYEAPVTTVAPLFLIVSLLSNMVCGPAILREQYRSKEVKTILLCVGLIFLGRHLDQQMISTKFKKHLTIRILNPKDLKNGEGWATVISASVWVATFLYYFWKFLLRNNLPQPILNLGRQPEEYYGDYASAVPVLSGLISGATYFEGYLGLPVGDMLFSKTGLKHLAHDQAVWDLIVMFVTAAFSLTFSLEGTRRFDCRYFVPASSTVGYFVATVIRILLEGDRKPPFLLIALCCVIHFCLLVIPFKCITQHPATIQLPQTLKEEPRLEAKHHEPLSLYRNGTVDTLPMQVTPLLELYESQERLGSNRAVLQSLERIASMKVIAPPGETWAAWLYDGWLSMAAWVPFIVVSLGLVPSVILAFLMIFDGRFHSRRTVLIALWCGLVTGTSSLRTAVFASVARWRVQLCMNKKYMVLLSKTISGTSGGYHESRRTKRLGGGRKVIMADPWDTPTSSSEDDETVPWERVHHFIVVDSDRSTSLNPEEVRALLSSLANSSMAKKQVSVFFTIKDPSQADKFEPLLAAELRKEATRAATESGAHFRALTSRAFASILRLYGDGKNAAKHGKEAEILVSLLLEHARELDTPDHLILVTRTTIDSTFHPEYLSAVTYAFLHSGLKRSRTIYQPPIFFLEDYGQQRWLTRYASMMLAQTSLSSLTDPFGMPLPKSTFTMVLGLLRSIDYSWEPNMNIKPFNIGIWTKCWLATIGRMSLQPIFLPVYRSGRNPVLDDNSVRRPEQGPFWHIGWQIRGPLKAQVLSMLELVHMWTAIPLAWYSGKESALKKRRIFSLMVRSVPPFCSVCWAHIVLSNWFIAVLLNLICVVHDLYWNWPPHNDEWCLSFTLGFTAVFLSTTPAFFSIFAHVDLHKLLPPTMTDAARAPSRTQWQKETTYTNFTGVSSARFRGWDAGATGWGCCEWTCCQKRLLPLLQRIQSASREVWSALQRLQAASREARRVGHDFCMLILTSAFAGPILFWMSMVEEVRLALTVTFSEQEETQAMKAQAGKKSTISASQSDKFRTYLRLR